jgi:hypothetical protein
MFLYFNRSQIFFEINFLWLFFYFYTYLIKKYKPMKVNLKPIKIHLEQEKLVEVTF